MTGLWRCASLAVAALIMLAGLGVWVATALFAPTAVASIQGVDVSSHQHPHNAVINWTDVAAAGNTFTAVKASEGTYYVNPYYASDAVQAAKAGLLVMPYAARQKTGQCYGLSRTALVTWIQRFMAEAQIKTGRKPVIYTTTAWWKACTGNSAAFGSYPLWIASYGKSDPALPAGWSKYTFWQHTSTGTVPGITGSTTDEDYLAQSRTPVQ